MLANSKATISVHNEEQMGEAIPAITKGEEGGAETIAVDIRIP